MTTFASIEKKMVKELKEGNTLALQKIYSYYSPKLYRFIYGTVRKHDDSVDILQTVFIKVWDSHEKLRTDTCFEAFIMTVTRHTVYNYLKHLYSQRNLSEKIASQEEKVVPASDEILIESELFQMLQHLIDTLPEKRRKIFIMNRFEWYTYREIADIQGVSENTVDSQMRKALEYIRRGISKNIFSLFLLFLIP